MSIRVGLYDFFAYTLPGVFYLGIVGFWLSVFGLMPVDPQALNGVSAFTAFAIVGAGYAFGLLMDPFAYRWMSLFHSRNERAAELAFDEFEMRHRWLKLKIKYSDWGLLLRAVKCKSLEAAMDVEQHNVASMMLRNFSFGISIVAASCLMYFLFINNHPLSLILLGVLLVFAKVAMSQSNARRHWFYIAIFEAFTAQYLLEEKINKLHSPADEVGQLKKVSQKQPETNTDER